MSSIIGISPIKNNKASNNKASNTTNIDEKNIICDF